jgi:hypothetical protein
VKDMRKRKNMKLCEKCKELNRKLRFPFARRATDLTRLGYTPWFEYEGKKHVIPIHELESVKVIPFKPLCYLNKDEQEKLRKHHLKMKKR